MTNDERIALLRRVCAETSQAAVARRLGVSPAIPCGVLKGEYKGDSEGFLLRVEEVYGSTTVECPGLGEVIPLSRCAEARRRTFSHAAVNPEWLRLWKVCRVCPVNGKQGGKP